MRAEKYYQNGRARNKKSVPEDGQSLQDLYPEIAEEFVKAVDPKEQNLKPKDYKPFFHQEALFRCPKCHNEWVQEIKVLVNARTYCPKCGKIYCMSFPERYIYRELKKMNETVEQQIPLNINNMQFDIMIKDKNVVVEYGNMELHNENDTDDIKGAYCENQGIRRILILENKELKEVKFNSDDEIEVPIKNIPDNLKYLDEVVKYIAEELELDYSLCDHQKSFEEAFLETRRPVKEEKKLQNKFPDLVKEWDYEKNGFMKPEQFQFGSHVKVWWKCSKCGASWQATINWRTGQNNDNCPKCGGGWTRQAE